MKGKKEGKEKEKMEVIKDREECWETVKKGGKGIDG